MRIFGIDGGIASIGWAVLELDGAHSAIIAAGVRTFDAPETDKERTPTNAVRRLHRGQRRVIRRRRQRMSGIRQLFQQHGLLPQADRDALKQPGLDPWCLRAEGLERPLSGVELAVALGHIARHRGFRSNAKREAGANAADETSKMKKAIAATQERLGQWQTVGLMFARDPAYADRKHNRGLNFDRSIQRSDHEAEVRALFAAQRRLGNALATEELQAAYADKAFSQLPLQDSEHLLAACPFEPDQKRTARRCYAFEKFRLLSRLAALRLTVRGQEDKALTAEQISLAAADFGRQKSLSYRWLRKTLELDPGVRFAGIAEKDEKNDFVARSGAVAEGTYALREVLGDAGWRVLMHNPVMRDRVGEVLTFREDPASIRRGLEEAGVEGLILDALMNGLAAGKFHAFTGAGHISAKAARRLLPALARGLVYSSACADVGYNHAAPVEIKLEDVRNPVARKAVTEMLKQVRAMVRAYGGLPDFIHVELARDIGKGVEERDKITKGIEDRNKERDKARQRLEEDILRRPASLEELIRYELWKEQNGFCLYTGDYIEPEWIAGGDRRVEVDHILPWSRFGDDSFMNKTLCKAHANQAKKGRTPFEWFEAEGLDWELFSARVENCKEMKGRKKGGFYLRKNATEVEERFRNRNLGDTRYATGLLLDLLARMYPVDGKRHVLARPGQLTAKLRRAWAVEDLKKGADGKRLEDDRHHALDAIVLAATSEAMLQALTKAAQEAERQGAPRGFDFTFVPSPVGFRDAVRTAVTSVFVSRAERHRARGEAHAATIKQVREIDGASVVFERKPVEKLTLANLENIPVPEPYGKVGDPAKLRDEMVAELRRWIEAGKPKDSLPHSPKGDVIRKVRVKTSDKVAVPVRDGTADRGDMARVDVFAKANKRGKREFYLVPVYPHEVADRKTFPAPPNEAVADAKSKSGWVPIDGSYEFLFCLYQNTLVSVTTPDGEIIRGYFKGLDRNTGAIKLASPENQRNLRTGIGTRRLGEFTKLHVDRLGSVTTVHREVRTWHGEACT